MAGNENAAESAETADADADATADAESSSELVEAQRPPRDQSIDVLKGIGIILIVLGHLDATQVGGSFITYLYTFHVAIFFVVAGYTWREKAGVSFLSVVVTKFRQIYVPYLVLFTISMLFGHLVMRFVFRQYVIPFELVPTLKAMVFSSEWLNYVPSFNFALWFLPIFFVASVAFQLLQKVRNIWVYLSVVVALAAVSIPFQELVPGRPVIAINVLPVALVFMALGYLIKRYIPVARITFFIALPVLAVSLLLAFYFPGNVAAIGSYWYFPGAIASILLYMKLAQDLSSSNFLAFIGKNSLIVFGIHGLVAATYPFARIHSTFYTGWDGFMLYLISAAYVILGSVVIVKVYRLVRRRIDRWRLERAPA